MDMDTATGKAAPAFDQAKLAAALAKATGKPVEADKLPLPTSISSRSQAAITTSNSTASTTCATCNGAGECTAKAKNGDEPGILSPDKTREAFIRDWNLWVRDVATGKETQLTTDGVKDFGYATDNAGWIHTDRAVVNWSPDSMKIATYQQDQRGVGEMYTVKHPGRSSAARCLEVPAARRQEGVHDRAGGDRRGHPQDRAPATAAAAAPVQPVRRHQLQQRRSLGRSEMGAGQQDAWPWSTARATASTSGIAWPTPIPARCAPRSTKASRITTKAAMARSTGTTCRDP